VLECVEVCYTVSGEVGWQNLHLGSEPVLQQIGLLTDLLSKIWKLPDIDKDRKLNLWHVSGGAWRGLCVRDAWKCVECV
jgi:hypothetical protein